MLGSAQTKFPPLIWPAEWKVPAPLGLKSTNICDVYILGGGGRKFLMSHFQLKCGTGIYNTWHDGFKGYRWKYLNEIHLNYLKEGEDWGERDHMVVARMATATRLRGSCGGNQYNLTPPGRLRQPIAENLCRPPRLSSTSKPALWSQLQNNYWHCQTQIHLNRSM